MFDSLTNLSLSSYTVEGLTGSVDHACFVNMSFSDRSFVQSLEIRFTVALVSLRFQRETTCTIVCNNVLSSVK